MSKLSCKLQVVSAVCFKLFYFRHQKNSFTGIPLSVTYLVHVPQCSFSNTISYERDIDVYMESLLTTQSLTCLTIDLRQMIWDGNLHLKANESVTCDIWWELISIFCCECFYIYGCYTLYPQTSSSVTNGINRLPSVVQVKISCSSSLTDTKLF